MQEENKAKEELIQGLLSLRRQVAELEKKEAEYRRAERALKESIEQLQKTLRGAINTLAFLVEIKDPYTASNQKRVAKLACSIAKKMALQEEKINSLQLAATIHDIGKVDIPFEILNKPGRLTEGQFGMIKAHPQTGYNLARSINFSSPIAKIILQHHERMNGSGYPQGLSGKDIMLEARILAVADVVDAMSSHRPYRPAHSIDESLEEISQNKNIFYDSDAVDVCINVFTRSDI